VHLFGFYYTNVSRYTALGMSNSPYIVTVTLASSTMKLHAIETCFLVEP